MANCFTKRRLLAAACAALLLLWPRLDLNAQLLYRNDATPEDRRRILKLLIREANDVAQALHLHEDLPIKEDQIRDVFMSPPRFANDYGALGNISTSNYSYSVSQGWKLSYIEKKHQQQAIEQWEQSFCGRVTTKASAYLAYQLATQWLTMVSMDVEGLNRNFPWVVTVEPCWGKTNQYLPLYEIRWKKGDAWDNEAALVSVFLPTKTLVRLRVEDARFILRKKVM